MARLPALGELSASPWLVSVRCTAPCHWRAQISADRTRITADLSVRVKAPRTGGPPDAVPKSHDFGGVGDSLGVRGSPERRIRADPRSFRGDPRPPRTRSRTKHGDERMCTLTRSPRRAETSQGAQPSRPRRATCRSQASWWGVRREIQDCRRGRKKLNSIVSNRWRRSLCSQPVRCWRVPSHALRIRYWG